MDKSVRITFFLILAVAVFGLIGYELFDLAYFEGPQSRAIAEKRRNAPDKFGRGDIYIKSSNGPVVAATTKKYPIIYVVPKDVNDKAGVSKTLAGILGIEKEIIDKALEKENDPYEELVRRADETLVQKIKEADMRGVNVTYEEGRYYPEGNFLSHVLGFVGFSEDGDSKAGQYGVEAFYENILAGPEGARSNIVLTIDRDIQFFAEKTLGEVLNKWNSRSGTIIVQDPTSGAILAMAASPSFDPNNYGSFEIRGFLNPAVQDVFEPGSSFKPVTMAVALDTGKINPKTTYYDSGEVNIAGFSIRNFDEKSHGVQTMVQVLEKSLNTGAIFVMNLIGFDPFLNYAVAFRFGERTGIDLAGELGGSLDNLKTVPKIHLNYATASFGQGIAVTPIQLITAYSALANGGRLFRPYVVDAIVNIDGSETKTKPEIISAPISKETSRILSDMLVSVVDNGFDKARIKGYDIAGKTGTAQIADSRGGYSEDFVHNFVGYAPASDPKFVILIKIDKPKGVKFASDSLSPFFREMTKFLLNYFNIPPTR